MSIILKDSIIRMRMRVVLTGRIAGTVMCRNAWRRVAPSTKAASRTSWSWPSMAASSTMNMNGIHCQESARMTTTRADQASLTHV